MAGLVGGVLTTAMLTTSYDVRFVTFEPVLKALVPLQELSDPLYSLIFILVIFAFSYWLSTTLSRLVVKKHWNAKNILVAAFIAITVSFSLEAAPTVHNLIVAWPQFFYQPPKLAAASASAKTAAKPDIYYIIMDRYASPEILKKQFGYDNADFLKYLSDNSFYVPTDSHQNYPYTAQSVASTMNLNYNSDMIQKFGSSSVQTTIPYNQTIRNSAVAGYLKSIGYQYTLVGNWYETSNISPLANQTYQVEGLLTVFNHIYTIDNFAKNELLNGVYWRFLQPGVAAGKYKLADYQNAGGDQMTIEQIRSLKTITLEPAGGRFIFAHILVPHDPYYFNADGSFSTNSEGNNFGIPIKQKYLNQVKFINSQMQIILDQIKQASHGQATVVLQSDEGPYPLDLNDENFDHDNVQGELASGNMLQWSETDLKIKFGNFAAYYVPNATPEALIAGGNTVNAFRLVLNTLFDEKLPYLTNCYYAYPNGRAQPFLYQNINLKLTGEPNSACANNGSGPKP